MHKPPHLPNKQFSSLSHELYPRIERHKLRVTPQKPRVHQAADKLQRREPAPLQRSTKWFVVRHVDFLKDAQARQVVTLCQPDPITHFHPF